MELRFLKNYPRATIRAARRVIGERRFRYRFPLPGVVEQELLRIDQDTKVDPGGYCPPRKQRVLASLIVTNRLTRTVEIGVYRGTSLLPQAVALRHTGGFAIGIDPYSASHAKQYDNLDRIRSTLGDGFQVNDVDFDGAHREMLDRIQDYGLSSHCKILQKPSAEAAELIEPNVDLIHIDGNHDADAVANDIRMYLPKLRSGGFLVLDDTNWDSIVPQYNALQSTLLLIYGKRNRSNKPPPWAVFQKC